jgi:outer membrane protein, heavy metal efflux system
MVSACASYRAVSLPQHPDLLDKVPPLTVGARQLPLPALRAHPFNPADGLDMTEVATVAVINSPDLKARRRKAGVARAQVFAARLLPDPQVSASLDHPTDPGYIDAYNLGLSYDLTALVTHGAGVDAARAAASQVVLDLLWQEWQVVQQARSLYVRSVLQARKLAILRRAQQLYARRYAHSARALRAGDVTLETAGTDLTALLDADTRVSDMERQLSQTRHDLNALLGLTPEAPLALAALPAPQPFTSAAVKAALRDLPKRRPDLRALAAGYASQEATVRKAILAQFPALSFGPTGARDTSDVHTIGVGITVSLPVLNRNRGEIAVQRATRAQLRAEYQARLDATYGDIDRVLAEQALALHRRNALAAQLPELERLVDQARRGYQAGDIAALTYLNMENTLLNKRLEAADLEQSLWDARIALDSLLAWPEGDAAAPSTGKSS